MARGGFIEWQRIDPILHEEHKRVPRKTLVVLSQELKVGYAALSNRVMHLRLRWNAAQEPVVELPTGYKRMPATPPSAAARKLAEFDPAVRHSVELFDRLVAATA